MTSVEDFTLLLPGVEVALEGRAARCSRCGRTGIERGRGYVIHVQVSCVLGDGMLTEPRDYCLLPQTGTAAKAGTDGNDSTESMPRPGGYLPAPLET